MSYIMLVCLVFLEIFKISLKFLFPQLDIVKQCCIMYTIHYTTLFNYVLYL